MTDPEEGLGRPADLSLRGLVGPGGGPGAQAKFGDPLPIPGRVELVELPAVRIVWRPRIVGNPGN